MTFQFHSLGGSGDPQHSCCAPCFISFCDYLMSQHRYMILSVNATSACLVDIDIADDFSVSRHVQQLTTSCSQSTYALRVLRNHGLSDGVIHVIYHAIVVGRLTYASSAWSGFTTAANRQRINDVMNRARRSGYCSPDLPVFEELCETSDEKLFHKAATYSNHILHTLMPPPSTASQHYDLRQRTHSLQLPEHTTHLSDCNFITRMLYKDVY